MKRMMILAGMTLVTLIVTGCTFTDGGFAFVVPPPLAAAVKAIPFVGNFLVGK